MNKIQDYLTSYYSKIIEKGYEYYEEFDTVLINLNKELWYDKCIKGNKKHIHLVMLNVNMKEIEELSKKDEVVINHLSYEKGQEKLRRSEIHEAIDVIMKYTSLTKKELAKLNNKKLIDL